MKLRLAAVAVILVLLLAVVTGVALAQDGGAALSVYFLTAPTGQVDIYFDDELIATVWQFSVADPLDVAWIPDGGANSYWVWLAEWDMMTGDVVGVVQQGHHWASNPNGTMFTFGGYDYTSPCQYCIWQVWVWPETVVQYYDPATDTYAYDYAYTGGVLQVSDFFLFQ